MNQNIQLIHGDSLQALKGYGDNYFDVAIVDPPYGIGYEIDAKYYHAAFKRFKEQTAQQSLW